MAKKSESLGTVFGVLMLVVAAMAAAIAVLHAT
jgi:hypothetical protein